jgi:hypothetical protein
VDERPSARVRVHGALGGSRRPPAYGPARGSAGHAGQAARGTKLLRGGRTPAGRSGHFAGRESRGRGQQTRRSAPRVAQYPRPPRDVEGRPNAGSSPAPPGRRRGVARQFRGVRPRHSDDRVRNAGRDPASPVPSHSRRGASGQATPLTYRAQDGGRQYLVIAAGGHGGLHSRLGDSVVAFSLPPLAGSAEAGS